MLLAWVAPPLLALQEGLERSNTFLSSFDVYLQEPITKLAVKRRQAPNCVQLI